MHDIERVGFNHQECTYGVVSRSGWVVVDDTPRPRFDADPEWPWVMSPPSRPYQALDAHLGVNVTLRQDWYLFGHGYDYPAALKDFTTVGGHITIPPKFTLGVFFSKWWPFSDVESRDIVAEYEQFSIPLDVLVTDMDW